MLSITADNKALLNDLARLVGRCWLLTDTTQTARYNADPDRLFGSSGCAGKLAVFAARPDTFPAE